MARTAVVWGLGRFGGGAAAAAYLGQLGYEVRIVDRAPAATLATGLEELRASGIACEVHGESAETLRGADLVVVNPAIPPHAPLLRALEERGAALTQELDLFLDAYPGRTIAVTGTNGKSTTAAMLAAALGGAGTDPDAVLLGGNIGHSLLRDRARWRADQVAVVEVSSFQATRLGRGARFAHAVLTPVTRDHLDWHGGLAAYHDAKLRVVDRVAGDGTILGHAKCEVLARRAGDGRVRRFGADDGLPRIGTGELRIQGGFNRDNASLALAMSVIHGVSEQDASAALRAFDGLPHRLREIGRHEGVRFVDNGASTVAETSRVAVESLARAGDVRWVCGGRAKERDLSAHAAIAPLAASVHVFGEVAPRIAEAIGSAGRVTIHDRVRGALDGAWGAARPGDSLLFSPGFTSHDQYPNYAARARDALEWWRKIGHRSWASGDS